MINDTMQDEMWTTDDVNFDDEAFIVTDEFDTETLALMKELGI